MSWTIDKTIEFCYGHRVHNQSLNVDFCERGDTSCKCRHPHGHQGKVIVYLKSHRLKNDMVVDFKHLGWLKNFIDDYIDHKFIIHKDDPVFTSMVADPFYKLTGRLYDSDVDTKVIYCPDTKHVTGEIIRIPKNAQVNNPLIEVLEGFFIVDFVPTSENLSKWLYDLVEVKMEKIGVKVDRIGWWETPKSHSEYAGS